MQYKAFTTWCNLHLKKANLELANLKTDFADGIKLIRLIEVISEESLGKYNKKPISKFQTNMDIVGHLDCISCTAGQLFTLLSDECFLASSGAS